VLIGAVGDFIGATGAFIGAAGAFIGAVGVGRFKRVRRLSFSDDNDSCLLFSDKFSERSF